MRIGKLAGVAAIVSGFLGLGMWPASAQEVTLRAVTAFAEGTQFSKNFERFIEKVNADGKGVLRINYIGGPRAMPPFEVGNAVRTKVVDIANVTGAFYTNLMPEADGFKLISKPMSDQRKNGAWEFINQLHNQKLNSYYLARQFHNVPFHIYLNKKPDRLDFAGLKIRVTPVYKDIVEALERGIDFARRGGDRGAAECLDDVLVDRRHADFQAGEVQFVGLLVCLLYTSDAADE